MTSNCSAAGRSPSSSSSSSRDHHAVYVVSWQTINQTGIGSTETSRDRKFMSNRA